KSATQRRATRWTDLGRRLGQCWRDVLFHAGAGNGTSVMTNRSIVLVEDNPDDLELMMRAFRTDTADCEIRVARDGASAIDLLLGSSDSSPPAVVLLDLKLPGADGFDVLRRIRGDTRT